MEKYTLTGHLHLRAEPRPDSDDRGVFPRGTVVEALGYNAAKTWAKVRIARLDGSIATGWMSMAYLTEAKPAPVQWQLGMNLREFAYYGSNVGIIKGTTDNLRNDQLNVCQAYGIKVIRFFASRSEQVFNLAAMIAQVKQALDLLQQFGMQAIIALDDSLSGANQYIHLNPDYHTANHGHLRTQYWKDKAYRNPYLTNVQQLVTTFANHPAVLMWELGNEFGLYPQPPQPGDERNFREFVREASGEIHRLAPSHLVSIGLVSTNEVFGQTPGATRRERENFAWQLYNLDSLHAVGVHYYKDNLSAERRDWIDIDYNVARRLNKLFYIGEIGALNTDGSRPRFFRDELTTWKGKAFTIMPWQLDSHTIPDWDIGIGDDRGIVRRRDSDYGAIMSTLQAFA